MTRQQLEHIIRAAAGITGTTELIVVGSQAILGRHPDAPAELLSSEEVDVFTLRSPDDAELIDGSIGEQSPFHRTFGYFAHGVGIETSTLPPGWQQRLVPVRSPSTGGATGLCLEPHDLAIAKLVAGRDKDMDFLRVMLRHQLVNPTTFTELLTATTLAPALRASVSQRLARLLAPAR